MIYNIVISLLLNETFNLMKEILREDLISDSQ